MNYLADTVAIVRHLTRHPALGRRAAQILGETDAGHHHVYVSAVSLMEVLYLAESKRITIALPQLIEHADASQNYSIVPIDAHIVTTAIAIDDVPELHDRMLVATAANLQAPILTGDQVIARSRYVTTIW